MPLPRTSKQIRRELATIAPADIALITAFVDGMTATGEAIAGKDTATLKGTIARELWTAGQEGSRFKWNRAALEFIAPGGTVPRVTVKAAADAVSKEAQFKLMDAALRMGQGKLDIGQWAVEHDQWLKVLHGAESALARGGFAEMTQGDWQSASDTVANQYGYSRAFFEDVANRRYGIPGEVDFSEKGVLNRSRLYAARGRETYENTLKDNARDRLNHTWAQRILAAVNNCNSCAEVAARGKIPIDEYPDIGTDDCFECHCVTITGKDDDE